MKHFLFLAITLASYSSMAQVSAQEAFMAKAEQAAMVRYEEKAKAETEQMNHLLHFTKVQQDSALAINRDYYRQLARLRDKKLAPAERERLITGIENIRESRLRKNLAAQQYQLCISRLTLKKTRVQHIRDSLTRVRGVRGEG